MRRLFALLAHPSVSETLLRERLDALYRRLLDSPIFTPPARRACDRDESPPHAPDPLLHRYLANLPSLCRERTASGGGGGGGGGATAAAAHAPLADALAVVEALHLRFCDGEGGGSERLSSLSVPLRAASRMLNLSRPEEERVEVLVP